MFYSLEVIIFSNCKTRQVRRFANLPNNQFLVASNMVNVVFTLILWVFYDFSLHGLVGHRKISQHYHEPIRPIVKEKSKKKRRSSKEEKKTEKEKFSKSPQKFPAIKVLPQISENKELTQEQISDHETEGAVWPKDQKDAGQRKHRHRHKHDREKRGHRRHHHHRGFSESDSLESRVRTGLQTLEEEKKAIFDISQELKEDQVLRTLDLKDRDTIQSHRFEDLNGVRRRVSRQRPKSGMTTHITHGEPTEKPAHVQITLPKYKYDHVPKEGFVELEELTCGTDNEMQWKERARWIKFEEDVEQNEQWGKPHIASLSFHSLLELRKGIESGTVLLDLESFDLNSIYESVAENMVITDQLSRANKEKVIDVLLSKHRHQHQQSRLKRNFSFSSLSSFTMDNSSTSGREKDSGIDSNVDVDIKHEEEPQKDQTQVDNNVVANKDSVVFELGDIEMDSDEVDHHKEPFMKESYFIDSDDDEKRATVKFGPTTVEETGEFKTESDVKSRVPVGAEATSVLVGTLPDLYQPTMAFVRLAKGCFLGNLTEVSIPVRFLFILLGPESRKKEYYEIGRSIATLMSDKIFHDLAYAAKNRDDLLSAINSFLDDSVVLAPGDWDRHLLLPLLEAEVAIKKRHRKMLLREKAAAHEMPADLNPFIRTGHIFGGLIREFRRKKAHFVSDFKDGLNLRCAIALIFIFFATLAPTITFGGLLGKKTDGWLGVQETLIATSFGGILFALFAGQPLIIIGTTGPILVFEQATYEFCNLLNIEFMAMRFWIGLWVLVILLGVVAFEGCYLVEYFSRFTEEVVSVLISFFFLYEAVYFLIKVFKEHPLKLSYESLEQADLIEKYFVNYTEQICNISLPELVRNESITEAPSLSPNNVGRPNTALMSLVLLIGTFLIAFFLRKFRNSHFFSSKWRRIMSDFGVPIAMIFMVCVDLTTDNIFTEKINIPQTLRPTKAERRGFFVNPLGDKKRLELGYIVLGVIPAILVSILIFMETELTGVLLNKKRNKLKKGGGFNLDLFMMGVLTGISSVFGLPWMCAATLRSVQHINALVIMSRCHAPGERPFLVEVKEQRLTNVAIHILVGLVLFMSDVIREIPYAVLLGVFLYLGLISLFSGIQFMEQMRLFFTPRKYHPNKRYIYMIPLYKILIYTAVQLLCLIILFVIKLTPVAPMFPFFFLIMAVIRKYLGRFFTEEELEELDNEEDSKEYDSDLDEYDTVYLPI
ncbi:band 3 anion transport protein-like isoform X2 [Rhopilema esculentum]|uniref:band 3 anion transport protein-like isoform X2 n=1 Tax=Rhopilema esculentum TaxID=499914 RepID=UPI0031E18FC3